MVCVYVYTPAYFFLHTYTIYASLNVRLRVCVDIHICILRICMCTSAHTPTFTSTRTRTQIQTHTHTHEHTYTRIHTLTHAYTILQRCDEQCVAANRTCRRRCGSPEDFSIGAAVTASAQQHITPQTRGSPQGTAHMGGCTLTVA